MYFTTTHKQLNSYDIFVFVFSMAKELILIPPHSIANHVLLSNNISLENERKLTMRRLEEYDRTETDDPLSEPLFYTVKPIGHDGM